MLGQLFFVEADKNVTKAVKKQHFAEGAESSFTALGRLNKVFGKKNRPNFGSFDLENRKFEKNIEKSHLFCKKILHFG